MVNTMSLEGRNSVVVRKVEGNYEAGSRQRSVDPAQGSTARRHL